MKLQRYELAGTYDDDVRPRSDGRWCESADVQILESELERLVEENKWLRKEKNGMIQYERDKRTQLYKAAEELGFWEDLEKSSKPPMSMEQLTSLDEEIENPIVVYYTAEGKLNPYDEDKREIFICFSSKEQEMIEYFKRHPYYMDMSNYERRVITHRGEYKIFPDKPESHQMDVNLWGGENVSDNGHSKLHEFSQGDIMLITRESVKDEAIETWFPQSNNGCFRDYDSDSECDIYDMNGPDCLVEGDTSLEACDAVYLYV